MEYITNLTVSEVVPWDNIAWFCCLIFFLSLVYERPCYYNLYAYSAEKFFPNFLKFVVALFLLKMIIIYFIVRSVQRYLLSALF